jgi:hypothetical protein
VAADEGRLLLEAPARILLRALSLYRRAISSGVYRLSEPPLPLRNEVVSSFRYSDEVQIPNNWESIAATMTASNFGRRA